MLSSSEAEKICILALVHTPGVGSVTIRQLISYCAGASNVFTAGYNKLIKIPGIGEKTVKAVLSKTGIALAEKEYQNCEKERVNLHFFQIRRTLRG